MIIFYDVNLDLIESLNLLLLTSELVKTGFKENKLVVSRNNMNIELN